MDVECWCSNLVADLSIFVVKRHIFVEQGRGAVWKNDLSVETRPLNFPFLPCHKSTKITTVTTASKVLWLSAENRSFTPTSPSNYRITKHYSQKNCNNAKHKGSKLKLIPWNQAEWKLGPSENSGHLSRPQLFIFKVEKVTQGFLLRSESTQKRGSRDGHACSRLEKTMIRKYKKILSLCSNPCYKWLLDSSF